MSSPVPPPSAAPPWLTAEVLQHLVTVDYNFQVRAFGEEMARVNFLPLAERRRYIAEMVDHAARKGVPRLHDTVETGTQGPSPLPDL